MTVKAVRNRRKTSMLTDAALRNFESKSKIYKAFDRDGMYVTVSPTGTVTFRYDYRLHGRRETLTIGRYGQPRNGWRVLGWLTAPRRCANTSSIGTFFRSSRTGCSPITADDLSTLCHKVKARGVPATAVQVRDIVKQIYAFAVLHGEKVEISVACTWPRRLRHSV
jgi:hypothetical protein